MHGYAKTGMQSPNFPFAAYETLRSNTHIFSTLFAYTYSRQFNVLAGGQAETVRGSFVSGNFASGLGVPPALGRMLDPTDDVPGGVPNVILSYPFWQRRFGGNPAAVGQSIRISGLPYTIVGVTAPGFFGVDPGASPSLYLPMHNLPAFAVRPADEERHRFLDRNFYWIEMMGRLQPGVSLEQAQAVLRAQFHAFAESTAKNSKEAATLPELVLEEGGSGLDSLRREYSKPLFVLMTMVGLILAIACANLANLLLARAAARRREMGVRLSLGAGRARILQQMLTESVMLALLGGVLGLAIGFAGVRFITWLLANGQAEFTLRASLSWPVLGFTFGLSLLAGMLFGLAPAIQATRTDFITALKESRSAGSRGHRGSLRWRLRHVLVAGQMALSLLLIVGAGLFVRTLVNLNSVDLGFNRENVLIFSLNGRQAGYRDAALARFYTGLLDRFREIPGVRSAALSDFPLAAHYVNNDNVSVAGRPSKPGDPPADFLDVDPAFLSTMQIPVVLGRDLEQADLASPTAAVVNQKFVTTYFDGQNPVGRQFSVGREHSVMYQVVGVARSAHYNSIQEPVPEVVYLPYTRDLPNLGGAFFELRTAGNPLAAVAAVRKAVHDASADVSMTDIATQQQEIDRTISQERTFANLGTCFAALALLIASVGLYGAMAYAVARRTGEIGIRMALGAQRPKIVWMVLREVLAVSAAGILVGYVAARWATRFVESFLFGTKANLILMGAALIAGYVPAWRASRIDPAVALRNE
jgi:predicted permease